MMMTNEEIKQRSYAEANRYMDNAKDNLIKAHKQDARVVARGFELAYKIINRIRPE